LDIDVAEAGDGGGAEGNSNNGDDQRGNNQVLQDNNNSANDPNKGGKDSHVSDTSKRVEDLEHFTLDETISTIKTKTHKGSLSVPSKRWYEMVEEDEEAEAALSDPPVKKGRSARSSASAGKRRISLPRPGDVAENLQVFVPGQEVVSEEIGLQHVDISDDAQVLASMSCTADCKQATPMVVNGSSYVGSSSSGLADSLMEPVTPTERCSSPSPSTQVSPQRSDYSSPVTHKVPF
jgi:hypothetical protein